MLVHDCNWARLFVVLVGKAPPPDDLDAHCLEILRADDVLPSRQTLVAVGRLSLSLHCSVHADVTHRNRKREAHVLDAWYGPYSSVDVFEEGSPLCLRVAKLPHVHVNVEDTFGPKTEIRTLSFEQAPHEQPGCGEKHEAESDLGHHEEAADPMTMSAR